MLTSGNLSQTLHVISSISESYQQLSRILLASIVPLSLLALLEITIFRSISSLPVWCKIAYVAIALMGYIGGVLAISQRGVRPIHRSAPVNFLVGWSFVSVTQKVALIIFFLIALIASSFLDPGTAYLVKLGAFILSLGLVLAMTYGLTYGKYRYVKEERDVHFDELPTDLEGLKVVHISDIHSGTWDSKEGVQKGIDLINAQQPDLILFTGDLVNTNKDEIDPFIEQFASLKARYGKYAILGNHDYYGQPREKELRPFYYQDLYGKIERMGFDLILNDSRKVVIGEDTLFLAGVENWGHGRFFPKRGDLDEAFAEVPAEGFTILMSHDPSHWDLKVRKFDRKVPLTLSGHTHAMQFGINLPFFKWSPVKYRYRYWMGLYESDNEKLYVNRGFGVLGYPGRVGMSPEVTVLNLRKSNSTSSTSS